MILTTESAQVFTFIQVYCINMYLRKYGWFGTQQQISFIMWPKHRAVMARQRADKTMVEVLFSNRKSPVRQYFVFKLNTNKETEMSVRKCAFFLFLMKVAASGRNTSSLHPHLHMREAAKGQTKCDQTLTSEPHMLRKHVGVGGITAWISFHFHFSKHAAFLRKTWNKFLP